METKEQLVQHIREWINIEQDIKSLLKQTKALRDKKKNLSEQLLSIMKENEIDCFDIKGGKLVYSKRTIKAPISKKNLHTALLSYFDDENEVNRITEHILDTREEKTQEVIRHKMYST